MGRPCSPETRAKIAARITGIVRSAETRAKNGAATKGRIVTAETRAKMSAAHIGIRQTPESIEKTRRGLLGRPLSAEHRENLRQAKLRNPVRYWQGKSRPAKSAATRAKLSAKLRGRSAPVIWRKCPYGEHVFRSSYEVRVAAALDRLGLAWTYEQHRFKLSNGRSYTPDFYLSDQNVFYEVKGWFSDQDQEKVARFRREYPDVSLVVVSIQCIKALERAAAVAA